MAAQAIAVMAVVVVTVPVVIAAAVIAVTWVVARVNSSVKIVVHVWLIQPSVLNAMRWSMLRKPCASWQPKPMVKR